MRKILIPVDFSESSANALRYTLKFFQGETCIFYLLSIYKAWEYTTQDLMQAKPDDSVYNSLVSENKQKLTDLIKELEVFSPGERFTFHGIADYDQFTDAIAQAVELNEIELIVMGTDGASGAKETIFGSHTLRVIRKVNSPILVVPINSEFEKPEKILFTIDYNTRFNKAFARSFKLLMDDPKMKVHILKMQAGEEEAKEEAPDKSLIERAFKNFELEYHCVKDVPTAEAINSLVQVLGIEINVLPVKREEFLERFLFGSAVSKIIYTTRVPLFIIHQEEAK
ncbi:universal stress protein [Salegentibacter chungangensis]|uniref:Universal stress protein n=1 Tax=Salegentibacter chungangensis TaxID=1335724 RepID=A0ABW3NPK6_9FLAO